jgi:hypothetical protein
MLSGPIREFYQRNFSMAEIEYSIVRNDLLMKAMYPFTWGKSRKGLPDVES